MPSPTTILALFLLLAFPLSLLLLSRFIKHRRRRPTRRIEPQGESAARRPVAPIPQGPAAAPPSQEGGDEMGRAASVQDGEGEQQRRRKKRGKKKRQEAPRGGLEVAPDAPGGGRQRGGSGGDGASSYPFSSFASATQRKIKQQYDQLVKSNQAKALTVDQVGQFINCLVEARNELQHKSEIIQRSFKIKKALLFKADRSSFDRLCQQIYKLEAEHKRLEEDAAVYNLLQEQLKLSPAYKTMLEIGANMEQKAELDQTTEFADISFEELLAQEKKDSFWQRNGKFRSSAS